MRPKERRESGQNDLFRARLDQIVDLDHPLLKLAGAIDWRFLEERFGAGYTDKAGRPPLPTRLMAGLAILKSMHDLSDEALCERWIENPYYQLLCGEEFFRHRLPFDRSSLTRWRQRMGEEKLKALIQESLQTATRTGAAKPSDFIRGHRRHDGAAEGDRLPDRCEAPAPARELLVRLAKKTRREIAPVLHAGRQDRAHRPSALRARQAVQARQPGAADAAHLTGPGHPRHRAQDRRRCRTCARSSARPLSLASGCASSASISAGARSIRCTRPRSSASARARRIDPTSSASRSRVATTLNRSRAASSSRT